MSDMPPTLPPLSDEIRQQLTIASCATLTTQLIKRGYRNAFLQGVRPVARGLPRMIGRAFTLRYIPAREDVDVYGVSSRPDNAQRRAIELVPAGEVLVIDCRREHLGGALGGILAKRLMKRGVAGVVTDGGLRDTPELESFGFPMYCAATSCPPNFANHHAVDFGLPIGCGGVAVYPGDVMVGDDEGVVVIPKDIVAEVAAEAAEQEAREVFLMEEIDKGRSIVGVYPPDDDTLARWEARKRQRPGG